MTEEETINGNIEHFKSEIEEYSNIDKRIKDLEEKIKPLRKEIQEIKKTRTELKLQICDFMKSNELGECEYNDPETSRTVIYKFNSRKTKKPINSSTLRDDLKRFFTLGPGKENQFYKYTSIEKATILYDYLLNNRDIKEINVLTTKLQK